MKREVEARLVQAYRVLTLFSAGLMALGWLVHLFRRDETNWLITLGIGLLVAVPLLVLAYLAWLTRHNERLTTRYALLALLLIGVALGIGLWLGIQR